MDDALHKTLRSLQVVRNETGPMTVVQWTGCVTLFTLCFREAIRAMRAWLSRHDRTCSSAGDAIQAAAKAGLIADEAAWLKGAQVQSPAFHLYSEEEALQVIEDTKSTYLPMLEMFVAEFDKRLAEETNDE